MLSVADVLQMPALRRGLPEVVAANDYLDREVRWAHVLDVPEVSGLLKGGEFVLNTGFGVGLDGGTQRSFIRQLADQEAAAVAVELGTPYSRSLPEPMRDEAQRVRLPLIALHRKTRFVEVTQAIHRQIMGTEFALLRQADEASRQLTELALNGAPLSELLGALSRLLANPVLLEDAAGSIVDWAADRTDPDLLLRTWQDLQQAERRNRNPRGYVAASLRFGDRAGGRLLALEFEDPFSELATTVVSRGADILSLYLASRRHEQELATHSRGALLDELMGGRLTDAEAARRAAALSFPQRPAVLIPVAAAWRHDHARPPASSWSALANDVHAGLRRAGMEALVGPRAHQLLLLIDPGHDGEEDALAEEVAGAILAALNDRGLGMHDLALAIGPRVRCWAGTGPALDRSSRRAAAAAGETPAPWHDARRVGLADVLFAMRDAPVLSAFVTDRIGALVDGDDRRRDELIHTLEVYLRNGGRKTQAARDLHLERQSMYYRLGRLQSLLGIDWNDGEDMLEVHLALRAHRLLERRSTATQRANGRHG